MIFVICLMIIFIDNVLSDKSLEYSILEERKIGYRIGNVFEDAKLKNLNNNKEKRQCRLIDLSNSVEKSTLVGINSESCELFVNKRIDREKLCGKLTCELQMSVLVSSSLWVSLTIFVKDINDNSPSFKDSSDDSGGIFIVRIKENSPLGHEVDLPVASDKDAGINAVIIYSIWPDLRWFKLKQADGRSLSLVVRSTIDYEDKNNRNLTGVLRACDHGTHKLCGEIALHVIVEDVNDNAPKCEQNLIEVKVMENAKVGSTITTVKATDMDDSEGSDNGKIRYFLQMQGQSGSDDAVRRFGVDVESGRVKLLKGLNGVSESRIELKIEARDMAGRREGSLSSICSVVVNMVDINDNAPKIVVTPTLGKRLEVNENLDRGVTVGLITATDRDSGENGNVVCRLNRSNPYVTIEFYRQVKHSFFYKLTTLQPIDREAVTVIMTVVVCEDNGRPVRQSASEQLVVHIIDVNEYDPVIATDQSEVSLPENSPMNVTLFKVTARDRDADAVLRFRLWTVEEAKEMVGNTGVSSAGSKIFQIGELDGIVKTRWNLDRETRAEWHVVVACVDLVYNNNNNDDNSDNGDNASNSGGGGGSYVRTASVTVTVHVQDVNDNSPELIEPRRLQLRENVGLGTNDGRRYRVGQLRAHDPDLGYNGTVEFLLKRVHGNCTLMVTKETGEVFAVGPVDRESDPEIEMHLLLQDKGVPTQSRWEKVIIKVLDENDNAPQWRFPQDGKMSRVNLTTLAPLVQPPMQSYTAPTVQQKGQKKESPSEIGQKQQQKQLQQQQQHQLAQRHIVTVIQAWDADGPENANISYRIISIIRNGDQRSQLLETGIFSVDSSSGQIMCIIDRVQPGEYTLQLQASDNGVRPLSSSIATLYVDVRPPTSDILLYPLGTSLSVTLIAALASITLIICLSLLTAIIIVRKHRYPGYHTNTNSSRGGGGTHNYGGSSDTAVDSLAKWTEEQAKYHHHHHQHHYQHQHGPPPPPPSDTWSYIGIPPLIGSNGANGSQSRLIVGGSLGEPLLPPPGPKDVGMSVGFHSPSSAATTATGSIIGGGAAGQSYTMIHLRRPTTNQDTDVASADSGKGASEEENGSGGFYDNRGRPDTRFKHKLYMTMPQNTMTTCYYDNNNSGTLSHTNMNNSNINNNSGIQYVSYVPPHPTIPITTTMTSVSNSTNPTYDVIGTISNCNSHFSNSAGSTVTPLDTVVSTNSDRQANIVVLKSNHNNNNNNNNNNSYSNDSNSNSNDFINDTGSATGLVDPISSFRPPTNL